MSRWRERWVQLLLAALLFFSYAYFLPRRLDWNQNGRMDLVLAIVDHGTLAIDAYRGNTGDYAHFGDHYYSDKAPGTSFLGVPFYWLFRALARAPLIGDGLRAVAAGAAPGPASAQELEGLFPWRGYYALALYAATLGAVALPSTLLALLLYRMARRLGASAGWAVLLIVVYGLGTTAFPYGSAFYGHMLAAACLFGAFFLVQTLPAGRSRTTTRSEASSDAEQATTDEQFASEDANSARFHMVQPARWLGAGFLLGWAVITEFPMILPAGVIGLYLIARAWERRSLPALLWVVAGGLVPLALMAAYDLAIYGTPLPAGYKYSEQWQEQVNTGFMTLTSPSLERLWGITFSPYRGLFFSSPALLFAVPGLVALWRMRGWRAAWWMIAGVVAALFAFNASSVVWWGGFAVGPRYVAPAVPFLALPIAAWLGRAGRWRWAFVAAGALSIAGIAAQTITSIQFYPPEMYRFPLVELSLPLLAQGQFALNLGNAVGLRGWLGLLPLGLGLAALGAALVRLCRPAGEEAR